MSTSTRPAWSDDCFKPQPERHYKGKRPSRRLVAGNSARTTSVASIVTQEGVHADEAADWLGLGARRRGPESVPPPPSGDEEPARGAGGECCADQHAAGQTSRRASQCVSRRSATSASYRRHQWRRRQSRTPPAPPPPPPPALTQTDSRRLGRRHFGGARTRPEGLLVWDESAHGGLCARGDRRPRGYRSARARALRRPRRRLTSAEDPSGASSVGTTRSQLILYFS